MSLRNFYNYLEKFELKHKVIKMSEFQHEIKESL